MSSDQSNNNNDNNDNNDNNNNDNLNNLNNKSNNPLEQNDKFKDKVEPNTKITNVLTNDKKDDDKDDDEYNDEDKDDEDDDDNDNDDDDNKNNIFKTDNSINPMNIILEEFIKNIIVGKEQSEKSNTTFSVNFDFVIENTNPDGKKETKSISSSGGKITFNDKTIDDVIDETDKMDETKEIKKDRIKELQKTDKKKQIKNLKKVDYASSIGDIKFLEQWVSSSSPIISDSYTNEAIDNASSNGKIEVLDWWKNAYTKHNLELKYTEKAINLASKFDKIDSLNWWINSGLELKYNHNAIDYASAECRIRILDWWLTKSIKDKLVKFEYSSNSIDNAKLEQQKLLRLIKWWNNVIKDKSNNITKFKYTRDFIDYLESWNYIEVYDYLIENKLVNKDEKFNPSDNTKTTNGDSSTIKILDFFDIPIGIGSGSGSKSIGGFGRGSGMGNKTNSKFDLETLPKDIQEHIKEKEEELNNNMMINGKAKEYIDNLVKIPFGKYKFEKIFCFVGDLINKINEINKSSPNDNIKKYILSNESDLVKFFDATKFFPDNSYNKYYTLYTMYINIRKKYMKYVDKVLEDTIYGHNSTKKQIKSIISQWLSGGFKLGIVIGIQGPPGVGKTTVIKGAISKCLVDFIDYSLDGDKIFLSQIDMNGEPEKVQPRPFCFTSLGGTTNGSTLSGHNITYHGATSGDIVKHLKEAKIMNPILYFDELDKISNTEHGHEISSVLTHITDPAQNSHFTDRYFAEVKIDLSKAIIVFSYNDTKKIDRILLDRIQEIRLNPIKSKEKIVICRKFIIPEICSQLGYNPDDVDISDTELGTIINEYTMEAGVRKLKEKLFEVFRMRHLELVENPKSNSSNKITSKFISDTFADYPQATHKKIKSTNIIGCINGLYASTTGLGGITPIQVKQIYCKDLLGISITGSVEKVMEESVRVAKTVGWNLLTREEQDKVIKEWDSRGLHIHFPDGGTPKDGPSGGTAITCAIYSLLTNRKIKNNVAITGEIDLDGNTTQIGGLDAKLNGAKKAGVKLALIPKENHREFLIVKKNNPELVDKNFKVYEISHVRDALKYIF